jgi:hypothetical protein
MENFRKMVLWLMVLMMATFLVECRGSVLHRVGGGRYCWAPNINFTEWSSHEQFYKGDWLCKLSFSLFRLESSQIICLNLIQFKKVIMKK